ncbi:hypothetical protein C7401_11133 [Paraburkholderia unamae]|uniref:hypothetical protein n=1 Tax=Paraburkholderia unamae TaxID=219649 RepID=UPI000DC3611C|nr:hypothetical protein [Paraburkholderia unamae]RAR59186.1 hypothetical protein C7401_11133 [Paraburkholderia unamae]
MSASQSLKSTLAACSHFFRDAAKVAVFGARRRPRALTLRMGTRFDLGAGAIWLAGPGKTLAVVAVSGGREAVHPEKMKNKPGCGVL